MTQPRDRALAAAIRDWLKAYPLDVFPEPDKREWKVARAALEHCPGAPLLDRISAANMRHVLTRLLEKAEDTAPAPDAVPAEGQPDTWMECYSCGCSMEASTKSRLLGYCNKHGSPRRGLIPPVPAEEQEKQRPACPTCGYTQADRELHGDHHLCPEDPNYMSSSEERRNRRKYGTGRASGGGDG